RRSARESGCPGCARESSARTSHAMRRRTKASIAGGTLSRVTRATTYEVPYMTLAPSITSSARTDVDGAARLRGTATPSVLDQPPEPIGVERHLTHPHPERRERIVDRLGDERRHGDGAGFPYPLDTERVERRRRLDVADLDLGDLERGRHQEVHERRGERLAGVVVDDALVERAADALRDAAADLALDDHRIHQGAAVVLDDVLQDREVPGVDVDLDDRGVAAAGEGGVRGRVVAARLQPRLFVLLEHGALPRLHEPQRRLGRALAVRVADWVCDRGQRAERQLLARHALDAHAPVGQLEVVRRDLEQARRPPKHLLANRHRGAVNRVAARHQAAARVGSGAPVAFRGVAGDDRGGGGAATDRVRGGLGARRAVPLALGGQARRNEDLAARLDTDVRTLVRADPGAFDVAAEPEPEITPGPACFGLAPAKIRGADHLDGHREAGRIVAAVVAGRRAVLER